MSKPALRGPVHLVGVGGIHMSAIARLLRARGLAVSGCDAVPDEARRVVEPFGVPVLGQHDPAHVAGVQTVIATAAVPPDHPELAAARAAAIPVLTRAQAVAVLVVRKRLVAVAGSHGKTTTTTAVAFLLERAGLRPMYLIGGLPVDLPSHVTAGRGRLAVIEADEYAGAFLEYQPSVAVVTNLDADHLDYFGSVERLEEAFLEFMAHVHPDGVIWSGAGSERLRAMLSATHGGRRPRAPIRWFGLEHDADWQAFDVAWLPRGGMSFALRAAARYAGRFATPLDGLHHLRNLVGALAACSSVGVEPETLAEAVRAFHGVQRRFQRIGEAGGVLVYDDYAHHPAECAATLAAARRRFPGARLLLLFQPHTYSRTAYLREGFRACFSAADQLWVLETYAARETPARGLGARELAAAIERPHAGYLATPEDAVEAVACAARPGDVCITMGAGDVTNVAPRLLERLAADA